MGVYSNKDLSVPQQARSISELRRTDAGSSLLRQSSCVGYSEAKSYCTYMVQLGEGWCMNRRTINLPVLYLVFFLVLFLCRFLPWRFFVNAHNAVEGSSLDSDGLTAIACCNRFRPRQDTAKHPSGKGEDY